MPRHEAVLTDTALTDTVLTDVRAGRVRAVAALTRRSVRARQGRFLVEGPQAVREAVRHRPGAVRVLYVDSAQPHRHADILAEARDGAIPVVPASPAVLAAMCDTDAPQGLLAVSRMIDVDVRDVLAARPRLLAVLTDVRDPGNAGTVIRGADAAGADAVLIGRASVDVYNPKVVRSAVGSHFHVPLVVGVDVPEVIAHLRAAGVRTLAADGNADRLLSDADLAGPHAWILGNEARGLRPAVREACDDVVAVPVYGQAESLNLAMAATVCLYASAQAQRRAT